MFHLEVSQSFYINIFDTFIVDCQWGEWELGKCSEECGTGFRTNTRAPKVFALFGGKECMGPNNITENCNIQPCPGNFTIIIQSILKAQYIILFISRKFNFISFIFKS